MSADIDTRPRRPVVLARTTHGLSAHQQNWRACNSPQYDDDDSLRAARGILTALAVSALLWIVCGALLWWSVELLAQ